jgi:hypothetical protein
MPHFDQKGGYWVMSDKFSVNDADEARNKAEVEKAK